MNIVGTLGIQHVYHHFSQLEFSQAARHYRRVNDAFLMHAVRDLDNEMHIRFSADAGLAMAEWADWFI